MQTPETFTQTWHVRRPVDLLGLCQASHFSHRSRVIFRGLPLEGQFRYGATPGIACPDQATVQIDELEVGHERGSLICLFRDISAESLIEFAELVVLLGGHCPELVASQKLLLSHGLRLNNVNLILLIKV